MLPNRDGRFHAWPIAIAVDEMGADKLAVVKIQFAITEEFTGGAYADVSEERMEIVGFFFLERKDGTLNEKTIESLKEVFGWDGRDPFWLQDSAAALAEIPVQIILDWETWNNQQRIKLQWLNPYGSTGGGDVVQAGDEKRRAIGSRLGSKLRAFAGGALANAPAPTGRPQAPRSTSRPAPPAASKSTAPPPTTPPPATPRAAAQPEPPAEPEALPTPPAAPDGDSTMEAVWGAFTAKLEEIAATSGAPCTQEAGEKEWFRILGDLFPGKDLADLTPAEWGQALGDVPAAVLPF